MSSTYSQTNNTQSKRFDALTNVAQDVPTYLQPGAFRGALFAVEMINPNASAIYVKFYDSSAASVNLANPLAQFLVPANGEIIARAGTQDRPWYFDQGLCVRCVTGFALTDATDPAVSPQCRFEVSNPTT